LAVVHENENEKEKDLNCYGAVITLQVEMLIRLLGIVKLSAATAALDRPSVNLSAAARHMRESMSAWSYSVPISVVSSLSVVVTSRMS
jgi:hypothetical protein